MVFINSADHLCPTETMMLVAGSLASVFGVKAKLQKIPQCVNTHTSLCPRNTRQSKSVEFNTLKRRNYDQMFELKSSLKTS